MSIMNKLGKKLISKKKKILIDPKPNKATFLSVLWEIFKKS